VEEAKVRPLAPRAAVAVLPSEVLEEPGEQPSAQPEGAAGQDVLLAAAERDAPQEAAVAELPLVVRVAEGAQLSAVQVAVVVAQLAAAQEEALVRPSVVQAERPSEVRPSVLRGRSLARQRKTMSRREPEAAESARLRLQLSSAESFESFSWRPVCEKKIQQRDEVCHSSHKSVRQQPIVIRRQQCGEAGWPANYFEFAGESACRE
jgi:hypothetical protein